MIAAEPEPKPEELNDPGSPPPELDFCPRCGQKIEMVVWGQTNCPRCGLHFECC